MIDSCHLVAAVPDLVEHLLERGVGPAGAGLGPGLALATHHGGLEVLGEAAAAHQHRHVRLRDVGRGARVVDLLLAASAMLHLYYLFQITHTHVRMVVRFFSCRAPGFP